MSYSRECMVVYGELLQLCTVYKNLYFVLQVAQESVSVLQVTQQLYQYYKSCRNPYQVLQVMWAASECGMESKVHMTKSISP